MVGSDGQKLRQSFHHFRNFLHVSQLKFFLNPVTQLKYRLIYFTSSSHLSFSVCSFYSLVI